MVGSGRYVRAEEMNSERTKKSYEIKFEKKKSKNESRAVHCAHTDRNKLDCTTR